MTNPTSNQTNFQNSVKPTREEEFFKKMRDGKKTILVYQSCLKKIQEMLQKEYGISGFESEEECIHRKQDIIDDQLSRLYGVWTVSKKTHTPKKALDFGLLGHLVDKAMPDSNQRYLSLYLNLIAFRVQVCLISMLKEEKNWTRSDAERHFELLDLLHESCFVDKKNESTYKKFIGSFDKIDSLGLDKKNTLFSSFLNKVKNFFHDFKRYFSSKKEAENLQSSSDESLIEALKEKEEKLKKSDVVNLYFDLSVKIKLDADEAQKWKEDPNIFKSLKNIKKIELALKDKIIDIILNPEKDFRGPMQNKGSLLYLTSSIEKSGNCAESFHYDQKAYVQELIRETSEKLSPFLLQLKDEIQHLKDSKPRRDPKYKKIPKYSNNYEKTNAREKKENSDQKFDSSIIQFAELLEDVKKYSDNIDNIIKNNDSIHRIYKKVARILHSDKCMGDEKKEEKEEKFKKLNNLKAALEVKKLDYKALREYLDYLNLNPSPSSTSSRVRP